MYDEETEELMEDYEELKGKIADLTKTASKPGGISLFTDETKTTYKSTYQLLKEISGIYDELTDKQQAGLLEALAGEISLPEDMETYLKYTSKCKDNLKPYTTICKKLYMIV